MAIVYMTRKQERILRMRRQSARASAAGLVRIDREMAVLAVQRVLQEDLANYAARRLAAVEQRLAGMRTRS